MIYYAMLCYAILYYTNTILILYYTHVRCASPAVSGIHRVGRLSPLAWYGTGNFYTKSFPTKNSWGKLSWGFPRD